MGGPSSHFSHEKVIKIKDNWVSAYLITERTQKIYKLRSGVFVQQLMKGNEASLRILAAALRSTAGENALSFFYAFFSGSKTMSKKQLNAIYDTSNSITKDMIPEALLMELRQTMMISRMESIGFQYDEHRKSFQFVPQEFGRFFLDRCRVFSSHSHLYIYNRCGVFEELYDEKLGRLIMAVMDEGKPNSWSMRNEREAVAAIKRLSIDDHALMNDHSQLINLENGMLNLETYQLMEHDPSYWSTSQIPIRYEALAKAPMFDKFVREIMEDDQERICLLQEIMGYFLTTDTRAEKAFLFFGGGANGKSVLADVIMQLVGPKNISHISLSDFNEQFGLENIVNKKLNISSENELGNQLFNSEKFKTIVSGESIEINQKNRSHFDYRPFCKLLFLSNSLPHSMDNTDGYYRKLMIIPFEKKIEQKDRDVHLKEKLRHELPGILNWAVEGLERLRAHRYQFSESKKVSQINRAYYLSQNPIEKFFEDTIVIDEKATIEKPEVFKRYLTWLEEQSKDIKGTTSNQIFWRMFKGVLAKKRVLLGKKKSRGTDYLIGLSFK